MQTMIGATIAQDGAVPRWIRQTAISVFLVLAMICGAFLTKADAQTYQFTTVAVVGNQRVEAATILNYAGIGRGQTVTAGDINDAYQRIVNSGLFEDVSVEPQGAKLVITVREFPTINVINFEGNDKLKDEDLQTIVKSQSRRVYSPSVAEADAAAITEAYRQTGRMAATVEPKIIRRSDNRVDLVFEVTEGRVIEVERLSFVGNRNFSDRRLRQILSTKQAGLLRLFVASDTFVADRIEFDKQLLRDFYLARGYVDFQVVDASAEFSRERDAFFLTFSLKEGQSFKVGKVSATSDVAEVDADEFQASLKLRSGVTYSPTIIEYNIARLENLALQKGLNFIRIDPRITRNDRDLSLDVEFVVTRGPRIFVERIDIEGNNTTLDRVIRRQFRTVEGDPFNPREVREAAERIRALGYFADAQVDAQQGSSSDQVIVNVDVQEKPTGSVSIGASYGVTSGLGFNIGFSESNFLGRGQFLSASINTASSTKDSSFSFVEPAFLGRDLRFRVAGYYRESTSNYSSYDTRNVGFSTGVEFPVSENGRLEFRYRVSEDSLLNVSTDSSEILQREAVFKGMITSALGYSYSYDTRGTGLNPNAGVLVRFGQDIGGFGGDTKMISTTALALAETKVWHEDVTLRAIVEGGAVHALSGGTRVTDRYFANGKIRGFEPNGLGPRDLNAVNEDALGGNLFAVARFEAEFPLGLPQEYGISGGAFFDVGSVWSLDDVAGTGGAVDDTLHLRSAVGLSLFWDTPVGPLRFNFSRAISKQTYDREQNFDLTISTKF